MTEPDALLPCPFCGGPARLIHDTESDYRAFHSYQVECDQCDADSAGSADRDKAIAAWNRRATLSEPTPGAQNGDAK